MSVFYLNTEVYILEMQDYYQIEIICKGKEM